MAEPVSLATIMAISALGSAASSGGSGYFAGQEARRQAALQKQQFDKQFEFNKDISTKQLAAQRRAELRNAPGTSMSWLQAMQALAQGASRPTSLDALGYLGGMR